MSDRGDGIRRVRRAERVSQTPKRCPGADLLRSFPRRGFTPLCAPYPLRPGTQGRPPRHHFPAIKKNSRRRGIGLRPEPARRFHAPTNTTIVRPLVPPCDIRIPPTWARPSPPIARPLMTSRPFFTTGPDLRAALRGADAAARIYGDVRGPGARTGISRDPC